RALARREDAKLAVEARRGRAVRVPRRRRDETRVERSRKRRRRLSAEQRLLSLPQALGVASRTRRLSPRRSRIEERGAFEQLGSDIAADVDLALQLVDPGTEGVRPGF